MRRPSSARSGKPSESFLAGALLAVVGGYLDVYTYLSRGQVFANAQTGNVVLLSIYLASGDVLRALFYVPPIAAFLIGIFVAEWLHRFEGRTFLHWRQYVILLELLVVVLVGLMPCSQPDAPYNNTIANVLVSFVCSLQVQSFRRIRGITCATTMCTGNLRSGADCFISFWNTKDRSQLHAALKYFGIVFFFMIGAAVSTYLTRLWGEHAVLCCAVGLVPVLLMMFDFPQKKTP